VGCELAEKGLDIAGFDGAPKGLAACGCCGCANELTAPANAENGVVVLFDIPGAGPLDGAPKGFGFCPRAEG
jgi:hypothetical protein